MPPLLQLRDIALTLGGAPLLDGAELSISPGDRIALVGRNGSGKSTLLRIAAGEALADRGTRFAQPSARLAYLPQEPDLGGFATTLDYVLAGLGEHDDEYSARNMLIELGLDLASKPGELSGGEARRAALVRFLAPEPEILLLDEPTNHLDLLAIEWLEAHLAASRSALALISHDRRLLSDLTRATVWLDRGVTHRLDQGFGAFEAWRDKKLEEEEVERQKLDRRIVNEEHWMRYGVTARRKRNMRRVGELANLRRERNEARRSTGMANVLAQEAKASGALVIEADRISKAFGDRPIVRDFSLRVMRGDRIGVVGANGAGKTTMISLLTGLLATRRGNGADRLQRVHGEPRSEAGVARARDHAGRRPDWGRQRLRDDQRRAPSRHRLYEGLSVRAGTGAHAHRETVGRRARAAHAREGARRAVEPDGARRAHQRPRHRDARPAAGAPRRVPGNDPDRQPRSRFSRSCRDLGDRSRRGRALDRICGRIFRHGRPARPWPEPRRDRALARRREPTRPPFAKPVALRRSASSAFNEKRALEQLPDRIDALRSEVEALEGRLADADLAAREPAAFEATMARYGAAREALEKAEDEWLALEILREELES